MLGGAKLRCVKNHKLHKGGILFAVKKFEQVPFVIFDPKRFEHRDVFLAEDLLLVMRLLISNACHYISLLQSLEFCLLSKPPIETVGYKYIAPLELK
jgi:hypothetical protein